MDVVTSLLEIGIAIILLSIILSPFFLVIINMFYLIKIPKTEDKINLSEFCGVFSFFSSILLTILFFGEDGSLTWNQWYVEISPFSKHTPIALPYLDSFAVMVIIGIIGYIMLAFFDIEKTPPLLYVIAISMIYIGMGVSVMWSVQTISESPFLSFYPLNYIAASLGLLRRKIYVYSHSNRILYHGKHSVLESIDKYLSNSHMWPIYSLLIMLPLLGIMICLLKLFGQDYDAIIKMWTETSDWTLSVKGEPTKHIVNIIEGEVDNDGHYLCTVAAGGHSKLVKPQRKGSRHGHKIIVNRQLCVANAFEQILEENTPCLHKAIRNFYNTYGLPIAKLIKRPLTADVIYILMKPLEWMFLMILYLTDAEPEKRIAVQYLPKKDREELLQMIEKQRARDNSELYTSKK